MLFWLALISLVFVTAAMADLVRGNRSIRLLREVRVALPARCARVSVVVAARDEALPAGWLGKNHALHRGAHEAAGTILIFADADVVLRPDTVTRAVAYAL